MSHRHDLLRILSDGRFHSGTAIGRTLGLSRTVICKAMHTLGDCGVDVYAVAGKGYRLPNAVELLTRDALFSGMSAQARGLVSQLEFHLELPSTNAHLMQLASRGAPTGSVCFAEYQSAGRGRRGRRWISPFGGNLYMSLLWRFPSAAAVANGLSPALGVAVAEAIQETTQIEVGLKWPNDVVWQGRKVAGILLEMAGESTGPCYVVAGIGVNVAIDAASATAIDQPWVDLTSIAAGPIARNRLAASVLQHALLTLQRFERDGFAPFAARWRARDAYAGKSALLHLPRESLRGTVNGIDERGALLFEHGGETRAYAAGELSLREVPA
jgi:BirA family biotin operon repressor/biotin-[acetyl-CoA-carboxylase] ligase